MDFQTPPLAVNPIVDGVKLVFSGPIHINTTWLERELDKIVAAKPKIVEMDLAGTEYISSHGLGILIDLHSRIKAAGGSIRVVAILKRTMGVFTVARLDRLFQIDPSVVVQK